jgi:hypothetical protein
LIEPNTTIIAGSPGGDRLAAIPGEAACSTAPN